MFVIFADDTTKFISDHNIQKVLNFLEENAELVICWFENNYTYLNADKNQLLISGFKRRLCELN